MCPNFLGDSRSLQPRDVPLAMSRESFGAIKLGLSKGRKVPPTRKPENKGSPSSGECIPAFLPSLFLVHRHRSRQLSFLVKQLVTVPEIPGPVGGIGTEIIPETGGHVFVIGLFSACQLCLVRV